MRRLLTVAVLALFGLFSLGATAQPRTLLTANQSYYVATTGSDANPCSATLPCLTLQAAANYIAQNVDLGTFNATVQVAPGTYSAGVSMLGPFTGGGWVSFQGNAEAPDQVVIDTATSQCFQATFADARFQVGGFKLVAPNGNGLYASAGGQIWINGNMDFGAVSPSGGAQIYIRTGSIINTAASWTVSGGGFAHMLLQYQGFFENAAAMSAAVVNDPTFSYTAYVDNATLYGTAMNYSGTAQGQRFIVQDYGLVNTNGGGPNYFPGSIAGTTPSGTYQ